jgi:hypothetical protein
LEQALILGLKLIIEDFDNDLDPLLEDVMLK